ncbi:MAG: hypothetical protein IJI58_01330 [Bacilli bacterium]|nr:hypothetical protein [Bacilli bacterium]
MIIGNNNPTNNSNFLKNNTSNHNMPNTPVNTIKEKTAAQINANVMNKNDMADKSFAMLHERYEKGLISIEEFTKQCNKLNKLRQK